jgi:glycosyltransferase involved in cell wall biosynthesis
VTGNVVTGWTPVPGAAGSRDPRVLIAGAFLSSSAGVRSVCEDVAEGLTARGWSVLVTSDVLPRGPRLADMLGTVWSRRRSYDVAQVDVYSGAAFVWAEAVGASLALLGCPFVVTLHSGAFPVFAATWPGRVRRLLAMATAVTAPSAFLREQMRLYRSGIRVIPNGVHVERYGGRALTEARPRLVWVRAFERRYNPTLALEVVRRLAADYPDIQLLMVGPDRADYSGAQATKDARELGVGERVRILGSVDKAAVPAVLAEGDIFLNTTNVDNAPVTVVEAMAAGLCVVSTDAGGVPYLIEHGRSGLVVPRGDVAAMAAAVARILREPALATRLSANGRRESQTFAWDNVLPRWEALLRALAR